MPVKNLVKVKLVFIWHLVSVKQLVEDFECRELILLPKKLLCSTFCFRCFRLNCPYELCRPPRELTFLRQPIYIDGTRYTYKGNVAKKIVYRIAKRISLPLHLWDVMLVVSPKGKSGLRQLTTWHRKKGVCYKVLRHLLARRLNMPLERMSIVLKEKCGFMSDHPIGMICKILLGDVKRIFE